MPIEEAQKDALQHIFHQKEEGRHLNFTPQKKAFQRKKSLRGKIIFGIFATRVVQMWCKSGKRKAPKISLSDY
jgi:hypothetical protein